MLITTHNIKGNFRPCAFADPVFLHHSNLTRPSGQFVAVQQQVFGIVSNSEKPLPQLFLLYRITAAPAQISFHLFISQNSLAVLTPVDIGLFPVNHILFKHFQKEPLLPAVVIGSAGGNLPVPVIGEAHFFQLMPHGMNIFICPCRRMCLVINGSIFRRHTKGIPPHGMKHIIAGHSFISCHHVTNGVISHMSHMDFTGWIGKHLKKIVFFPGLTFRCPKNLIFLPVLLPFRFNLIRHITILNRCITILIRHITFIPHNTHSTSVTL